MFVHLDGSFIPAERPKNKLQLLVMLRSASGSTVIAGKRLNKNMKNTSSYVVSVSHTAPTSSSERANAPRAADN